MHGLTRHHRLRRDGERGSVMVAVMIIFVASIAVLGTVQAVVGGLSLARTDQSRANAFQFANAGVDQVLYRLDRQDLPTTPSGTYVPTVVAGQVTGFTEDLSVGGSDFAVSVVQDPVGQTTSWRVNAIGTDPTQRQRQAVATIRADRLFEEGFFTLNNFYLTGNQTTPVAYDSNVCPTALPSCQLTLPVPGRIGTNATFDGSGVSHFSDEWEGFTMYGRATQAAANAACIGCPPAKVRAVTDQKVVVTPDPPAGVQACPNGGNITGTVAPGDYACTELNLQGTVTVSGTGNARFWVSGAFSAASNSVVNRQQRTARFQVFQSETAGQGTGICDSELWALLFTPGLTIDCPGSHQPEIYGAVVANIHAGTGNQFDFHWDVGGTDEVHNGLYVLRNWRECPVGIDDC